MPDPAVPGLLQTRSSSALLPSSTGCRKYLCPPLFYTYTHTQSPLQPQGWGPTVICKKGREEML